ncbi:serine hydrolase domain-containing protein [Hamadaea tsunoensis]|uniref:serine hydrolase domain-containing protein n=1 Tax=Hamadaea tsunoensis TaxID=53368 RepID=UPI000425D3FD|nr:serine hydrolase domain-containing protein [Hamadaea tsunoensis]
MSAQPALLPRSTPAAAGVSSRAIGALLDRLEERSVELHSIMVVRHGHVVAEGWWAPYTAERPHLLYSLTKSFTSIAVGLAIADGRLSLTDRVVDILPDHVPPQVPEQARRITVHHLLSMTVGHADDSLTEAWQLEPHDLVKGFLRVPFTEPEGTRHTYDNATTYVLARMVERVTGRDLPGYLDERLFRPLGVDHAEWDRVATGAAFGFHGLHLTTEAVAAFGELLLRGGVHGDRQLIPREWVEVATRRHVDTAQVDGWSANPDILCGYGYQFWMTRHGYRGAGAFGQQCLVIPEHDLVVVLTGAESPETETPGALWDCLLPGMDDPATSEDDELLAERLRNLSLPKIHGTADPSRSAVATIDASTPESALAEGSTVAVEPVEDGWLLRLGDSIKVAAGHGTWRESSPLGRPVVAMGAWRDGLFVADLYNITTPHRVRLEIDPGVGKATATWATMPLTGPILERHLRSPLMTRPDVA